MKQAVYWVEFFAPGSFVANTWTKDLDGETRPESIEWPDNAYAFELWRRLDIVEGKERYKGKPEQVGKTFYHPDSKVETLAEVKANPRASNILTQNMEINDWDRIIWSRWNNWPQPFNPAKAQVLRSIR